MTNACFFRSRFLALVSLGLLATSSCGGDGEKADANVGGDSASGGASSGGESSGAGGGARGGSSNGGTGGGEMLPEPTSRCAQRMLPARDGRVINVSPAGAGKVIQGDQETTLRAVVADAEEGDTIVLGRGTYTFDEAGEGSYTGLYVTTPNISIVGEDSDAGAVILDSNYTDHGMQTAVISVDAPGVVLADFTVQESIFHLIHLWEEADESIIHNVTLQDGGQQFLKASPGSGTVNGTEVSCSRFVMTEQGRDNVWGYGDSEGNTTCYTGGIDTHNGTNWHVHSSYFEGIYCDTEPGRPAHGKKAADRGDQSYAGGLSEHAIHMWDSPDGTAHLIEGNRIVNCARGVGIGLRDPVYGSHRTQ